jgi:PilZ domain-containing protein
MLSERRKDRRTVINHAATFQADVGALPRDCMITNVSRRGARLLIDGADVPDQFHLLIEPDEHRECRVVWRLGGEIGVAFVDAPLREPSVAD